MDFRGIIASVARKTLVRFLILLIVVPAAILLLS
jgi:hypothetical protein